ncbi:hypothetical protein [Glycomyces tenuis]|uniref:hypothetical protein n=1 Tax=Glycomyces tenuis TaxID=58116 RepID=UPI000424EE85|nr:hypothetical protein [Glycomyces tenuis]
MTTAAQLRKTALSNPDASEGADEGARTFAVGGRVFAALDAEGRVRVRLPDGEAEDMLAQHATAERADGFVRLPIADINGQALNHWVRRAWLACAPPDLAAAAAAAERAEAGAVGDLPKAIGRPATRALADAGITALDQVAELSDAELGALHGVGPKAVRILREALDAR